MSKDLVKVMILSSIFVRGEMFKKGDVVEVNKREAAELISRGKATEDIEVDVGIEGISFNEMTLAELAEVNYKELNKDPLIEYATACGLEIGDENKKEIYALIETVDFEADEE